MKKIISLFVAVATLTFVGVIFIHRFDIILKSFLAHKFYFFLIAVIYIISRMLDGIKLNILTSYFGVTLKLNECFGLSLVMPLYNLIFPNAGMVTNAIYLKSKYKFKFRHFISVSLLRFVTTVVFCAAIGIFGSIIYMQQKNNSILICPLVIYVASIIISLTIFFVPMPRLTILRKYNLYSKLEEAIKGFNEIKAHGKIIISLVFIQAMITLLFIVRYYIVLKALSLDAPIISMLAVVPLTELSNLINLIPANLAIREAVVSGGLTLLGYTLNDGILVAVVDRAVLFTTTLITGIWFFIRLKYSDNLILSSKIAVKAETYD